VARALVGCKARVVRKSITSYRGAEYCGLDTVSSGKYCLFHLLLDRDHSARLRARGERQAFKQDSTRQVLMTDPIRYDALMSELIEAARLVGVKTQRE